MPDTKYPLLSSALDILIDDLKERKERLTMANTAVISSKQIAETGRMDAAFNIAYSEHKPEMRRLIATTSREQLERIARSIPFDRSASRVRAGNNPQGHYERWTPEELALYLLIIDEESDGRAMFAHAQSLRNQAEDISRLNALFDYNRGVAFTLAFDTENPPGNVTSTDYLLNLWTSRMEAMRAESEEVTYQQFCEVCEGMDEWEAAHGYETSPDGYGLKLVNDYAVNFYRSKWRDSLCFFIDWSAHQYVWTYKGDRNFC